MNILEVLIAPLAPFGRRALCVCVFDNVRPIKLIDKKKQRQQQQQQQQKKKGTPSPQLIWAASINIFGLELTAGVCGNDVM